MVRDLSLVYVHIGTVLPKYLYDSLYQTLLINGYKAKIYVILSDGLVDEFNKVINNFNLDYYVKDICFNFCSVIQVVPLSVLEMKGVNDFQFTNYKNVVTSKFSDLSSFRDGFWVSTTSRFYYISILMEMFSVKNVFHIESDIMMYDSFDRIYNLICKQRSCEYINKICMVQDAPNRVIPSVLFFPSYVVLSNLTQFITNELSYSNKFMNDMDILGKYEDKYELPFMPNEFGDVIFDGAALGQYIGGVDYRNILGDVDYNNLSKEQQLVIYDNPTRGFINETAVIKCTDYKFSRTKTILDNLCVPVKIPILYKNKISRIMNLHVHSKQLYQFSSASDLLYKEIISGDRILSLCDFVLTTYEIYGFHKNIGKYVKDIIMIRDFRDVKIKLLNTYFRNCSSKKGDGVVKIFIYTHMLDNFTKFVFPYLDKSIEYIFYLHNSDHSFNDKHKEILKSDNVKKVYAQNIDTTVDSEKLTLLPIGMANSMWDHGDLLVLYKVISETYLLRKNKSIYVNINPNTYSYRLDVLNKIREYGKLEISSGKPYKEYLVDLSNHRFCLCLRGNGIDTHRFWESLYLGVIPVILSNKITGCQNFVRYLKKLEVPFYEICEDDLDVVCNKYDSDYFSEDLYKNIISKYKSTVYNSDFLKLTSYR